MSPELKTASPARQEPQISRRVTMDTATTPSIAVKPPTNMPEPSPNKSAAAMALSLLGQKNNAIPPPPSPPPPTTTSPAEVSVSLSSAAKRPVPTPAPPMPHPHYAAWQQYHYPNHHHHQSPYPVKKLKVSHAEVTKNMTTTPSYRGMHPPPPHVPSPYAAYPPPPQQGMTPFAPGKNGMPAMYGQPPALYHAPYPSPSASVYAGKPRPPLPVTSSMVTPTPKKQNYSRKSKSLGILCENFISTFSKASDKDICIDNAAAALGVERRRIYDIINIFESLEIVQRKCKNTYEWLGTAQLPQVLAKFQQEAFHEFPEEAVANGLLQGHVTPRPPPNKGAKKSLGKLSQQFVQLFLTGHKVLSLNDASDRILGVSSVNELAGNQSHMKTKIRRMYDISNVFVALRLLEKVGGESRRAQPKFSWVYKLSAEDILKQRLESEKRTMRTVLTVTIPKVELKMEPPSTTTAPPPPHVTQDEEDESRDDVEDSVVVKMDETNASTTPVCEDKKLLANIHAMGAADFAPPHALLAPPHERDETDLCRTVSVTADL